jgi:hypothetical protein
MTLGLLIAASDLVVNLLGLLLDRVQPLFRRSTRAVAPIYVIHNHYVVHNHCGTCRLTSTPTATITTVPEKKSNPRR